MAVVGKIDLHGSCWRDLESLKSISCRHGLHLVLKLHECDVGPAGDQPDLLEPGELVEQHAEHHLVGLPWQVGQEQDLVGGSVVHTTLTTHGSWTSSSGSSTLGFLGLLLDLCWSLLGSLLEGSFNLGDHVGVGLGVVDPHGLVIEWETLHGSQSICG